VSHKIYACADAEYLQEQCKLLQPQILTPLLTHCSLPYSPRRDFLRLDRLCKGR